MERLTEHYGDRYIRIKGCTSAYLNKERKSAPASNAVVRLAAYEDAIPFDALPRVAELLQADKEGRCIVLPYKPPKVGDVVYEPVYEHGIVRNTITFSDGLTFEAHGKGGYVQLCISDIGKTVFLTRAEAEAALGGGGDG